MRGERARAEPEEVGRWGGNNREIKKSGMMVARRPREEGAEWMLHEEEDVAVGAHSEFLGRG